MDACLFGERARRWSDMRAKPRASFTSLSPRCHAKNQASMNVATTRAATRLIGGYVAAC
ncbi:hypothetical protein Fuma_02036 [Fuerstiella marisgermanici]|uniref:Uncharacterized protein n=1 Tax=Fuerstiella marisgermanici TaxID=1891926 RepID=A0A1P8WEC9_9PLAN|nr:hypothetical protein Fuma_02036 [Fuerstiella marisgermanici]